MIFFITLFITNLGCKVDGDERKCECDRPKQQDKKMYSIIIIFARIKFYQVNQNS